MADSAKVLNTGLSIITNLLSGIGGSVPKYIGWGTGATPPVVGNTGLQSPASEARVGSNNPTRQTTAVANDTMRVVQTLTCSGSAKTITEVALFDASSGGNCFSRATFDPINVSIGDSIEFTINVVFEPKA